MPNSDEYYSLLGVEKSCTDNEVKTAFREKVKRIHPDNSVNNGDAEIDNGQISRLIEARDWLLKNRNLSDKTKGFQEEQQKKKRKNLKIKISKTLNKIKNWDLRGIKLCVNKQIVGEIIDQKINPLIFFQEELQKEVNSRNNMVDNPFIIGRAWNNKEILDGFREQKTKAN